MALLRVGRLPLICSNIPLHFLKSNENDSQVDSIYTDFSKGFDRVRHIIINFWTAGTLNITELARCQWLRSYFSGRI
jgi:hypothetical protein